MVSPLQRRIEETEAASKAARRNREGGSFSKPSGSKPPRRKKTATGRYKTGAVFAFSTRHLAGAINPTIAKTLRRA
jgi:hypothetical protein